MLAATTTQAAAKTRSANSGQFGMIDVCGALREAAVELLQRRRIVRVSWAVMALSGTCLLHSPSSDASDWNPPQERQHGRITSR